MASSGIIERIEHGELKFHDEIDGASIHIDLQAADTLGVLLKKIQLESPRLPKDIPATLRKQSATLVERLSFLEALKVIEVDGVSHAVQIRSQKPTEEGFIEIILRRGNSISFERRGSPLHISKPYFERLIKDLRILSTGSVTGPEGPSERVNESALEVRRECSPGGQA